ncbi:MAG: hypothetical protein FWB96_03680 [Defluviitaleaceae bacterium]|nr:hypothetical protein [Defluviitaleaceae bacterium]MCL2262147.1 hypothetical protein [Defluviitaleaceae bacterium]
MTETTAKHYSLCLIDRLPEKFLPDIATTLESTVRMVVGEKEIEKARQNAEYLEKLEQSGQQIKEGKTITFTIEELESFETMPPTEVEAFAEKRKKGLV